MFLDYTEWFLLGAFSFIFLYFITYYFAKRAEKYALYFAIGCLVSIVRTLVENLNDTIGITDSYYPLIVKTSYLSFVWGPVLYILLANSLYPKTSRKVPIRVFLVIGAALSAFIISVPVSMYPKAILYDYFIFACMIYATVVFTHALVQRKRFAVPLFFANLIFIGGVVHDVLYGSYIIKSSVGEIHAYAYFIYLYIMSVVIAKKYILIEQEHLKSRVRFLHAQIRPHFLYNTINTIRAYCRTDVEKSRELLEHLSTYLRGKFENGDEMLTPLKDELELVKAYLAIEQVRFEERLKVEYNIDNECDVLIPCLIIQPIVENAVKHGLAPKIKGGKISICVKRVEDSIVVVISDDGVGVDRAKLPDILLGEDTGIGISNTNERMKRYYDTEIDVHSVEGEGTTFTLTIPIKGGRHQ